MTLHKKAMVREIGRRTGLKQRDVQLMLETLVDVWTEELVADGRIEIEHLFVLETQMVDRGENAGTLKSGGDIPRYVRRVNLRASKRLKRSINKL